MKHAFSSVGVRVLLVLLAAFLVECGLVPMQTSEPTPEVVSTAVVGHTRQNPLPHTEEPITVGPWEIRVKRVVRGDPAWVMLREARSANQPPPLGYEYLLVHYHIRFAPSSDESDTLALRITGDHNQLYSYYDSGVYGPDPRLNTRPEPGEETEGWLAYQIRQDEANLLLMVDLFFDEGTDLYVALEPSAAVTRDPALDDLVPTEEGLLLIEPAPTGVQLITEDWQLAVREVIYGDEAWQLAYAANKFNDPPAEGMMYALIKLSVRYIGASETARSINEFAFEIIDSEGIKYRPPAVVNPDPELSFYLFPGGMAEGWIVMELPADEPQPILIFDPGYEFEHVNKRFLQLPGYGR